MRPEQQTTIPEIPHVHKMNLVLFCSKTYFIVVKQENKVHHVKLGIFPPHLHINLLKLELRLFSYEINHFSMAFKQNKYKQHVKHLKHG